MPFKDPPKPPETKIIELGRGQYATLPGTTKGALFGPGKLRIVRYPDGAVDGTILEGSTGLIDVAVRQKLERVGW